MSQKHINEGLEQRIRELEEEISVLRQSNEKYRQLVENLNEILYTLDENAVVTYVSPNVEKIGGYKPEEIIGRRYTDFVHPEDLENRLESTERMRSGEDLVTEYRFLRKSGEAMWVRSHGKPILQEGGPIGLQGMLVDITDRIKMEEKLRRSEKKFRDFFNSTSDSIFAHDTKGQILEANEIACRETGYAREELLQEKMDTIAPEYQYLSNKQIKGLKENGQFVFEAMINRKDGTGYPVEVKTHLIEYEGEPCIIAVARDITRRRQAEEEKAEVLEQFYHLQKLESIGRLAGGVAHDLNNFLSPILGYGEMLLEYVSSDETCRSYLNQIIDSGGRARALVRQLLAFGRQQVLDFKPIDLNQLMKNFQKLLRYTLRENIAIHLNFADSLPLIKGDAAQIEQILMNLAVNAQDAMPHGGELTIETANVELDESYALWKKGVKPGNYVMLTVSDTGEGMDADTMNNIFEPFYTTKGKEKGTGLGLSTAYGIVKQHEGNIWAYSEPGLGTTFRVYFPVSPDSRKPDESSPEKIFELEQNGSEVVLLAEDEEVVRNMVSSMLQRQGYKVLAAQNGTEALGMFKESTEPVELLLTDVIMPDMNGKELYAEILKSYPDLKAIFMSGYNENVISHHGILEPGLNFIQKPFSIKELVKKLQEVLGH